MSFQSLGYLVIILKGSIMNSIPKQINDRLKKIPLVKAHKNGKLNLK